MVENNGRFKRINGKRSNIFVERNGNETFLTSVNNIRFT